MKKAMLALAAVAALALTACEKKEEAPVTDTGATVTTPDAATTPAGSDAAPADAAATPAADAAATTTTM